MGESERGEGVTRGDRLGDVANEWTGRRHGRVRAAESSASVDADLNCTDHIASCIELNTDRRVSNAFPPWTRGRHERQGRTDVRDAAGSLLGGAAVCVGGTDLIQAEWWCGGVGGWGVGE